MIPLAMGEVISPIMAMKQGFGLPVPPPGSRRAASLNRALLGQARLPPAPGQGTAARMALDVVPSGWDPIQAHLFRASEPGPVRPLATTLPARPTRCGLPLALALAPIDRPTRIRTTRKERTRTREGQGAEPSFPRSSWARRSRKW